MRNATILAAVLIAGAAPAQTQQQTDACSDSKAPPEQQISGCSAVIGPSPSKDGKIAWTYVNRGFAGQAKGELDRALAGFDEAIALDPNGADAYFHRGLAGFAKGDLDRAVADFDKAIASIRNARAYAARGKALKAKGDLDRALADFDEAARLDPKDSKIYWDRGRVNLYAGALPKALADLDQASALDPQYPYVALWLDIVDRRNGLTSRLADTSKQIDMTQWPAPVIRLYLGQSTPEATMAAADDPDAFTKKSQTCEANFYSGDLALQQSRKDDARRLFDLAAADCPRDFMEYDSARDELKALDAGG